VYKAGQKMMAGVQKGLTPKHTWDKFAGISLIEATNAQVHYFTFKNFMEEIVSISNESVKDVLSKLCCL